MNELHEKLIKEKLFVFERGATIYNISLEDDTSNPKYPDYIVNCETATGNFVIIRARIMNNLYCEMRVIRRYTGMPLTDYCPLCERNVELKIESVTKENKSETFRQYNNRTAPIKDRGWKSYLIPAVITEIFIKCKYCHRELRYKRIQTGLDNMEKRFK